MLRTRELRRFAAVTVAGLSFAIAASARAATPTRIYFKQNGIAAAGLDPSGNLYTRADEKIFGNTRGFPLSGLLIKQNGVALYSVREANSNDPEQFGQWVTANYFVVEIIPTLPIEPAGSGVMVMKFNGSAKLEFDHLDNGGSVLINGHITRKFGYRKNASNLTDLEKANYVAAVVALHATKYPGANGGAGSCDTTTTGPNYLGVTKSYRLPGAVDFYSKFDEIHTNTQIHGAPNGWPWHRELLTRFEGQLRAIDPTISVPYWDFTNSPIDLMTTNFMGNANGAIGGAWATNKFYDPSCSTACMTSGVDPCTSSNTINPLCPNPCRDLPPPPGDLSGDQSIWQRWNAAFPPKSIDRSLIPGSNVTDFTTESGVLNCRTTWPGVRAMLDVWHLDGHVLIGGTMGPIQSSARDPIFYLLHSNVDRLFASWQKIHSAYGQDPVHMFDPESSTGSSSGGTEGILTPLEPWADVAPTNNFNGYRHVRPFTTHCTPAGNCTGDPPQPLSKNSKDPSLVPPVLYEEMVPAAAIPDCSGF